MFASFFPNPKVFFPAALIWTAITMALWYGVARNLGPTLSIGGLFGYPYPPADASDAVVAVEVARSLWLYEYMIVMGALFVGAARLGWAPLSFWGVVGVSGRILFLLW